MEQRSTALARPKRKKGSHAGLPQRAAITAEGLPAAKERFLEALTGHLTLENAALAAGTTRRTVFKWRQEDPEFAAACDAAKEAALDRLEDKAYEVALNADGIYYEKDALLNRFFVLKGHRPHFKDAYRPEVEVREVHFTFEIPKPVGLQGLPEHVIEGEILSTDG